METPDKWVILKMKNPQTEKVLYKVLAGWGGSYTNGESYRINSGITRVELDGDNYLFHGYSGSIYSCHKNGYGASVFMLDVISPFMEHIEIMDENTNFMELPCQN